jgi:hypothetical protein
MTPFLSLLLPVVVAAVAVFILSLIVMAMPWHRSDYGSVPNDDAAIDAIRSLNLAPGDYGVPNPRLPGGGPNPDFIANWERGPSFRMTVVPPGNISMGVYIGSWFGFTLLVAAIAGWTTGMFVGPGGNDHAIFHLAGIITFCSYTLGAWPFSIWFHRKWSTTLKGAFDAVLYGAATGLIFTWLWPKL